MSKKLLRLKTRLKLKQLCKKADEEIHENFGFCPNTEYFNKIFEELKHWEMIAKKNFPKFYEEYSNLRY